MNLIRQLKFANRLALLMAVLSLGLLGYGIWSYKVVSTVRVGGPIYAQIINSHDLVSDVLPPPLYVIESYLLCLQLTAATNGRNQGSLIDRLKEKQEDYERRYAYWSQIPMAPDIADLLLTKSHAEALHFFDVSNHAFLPALFLNDRVGMEKAIAQLTRIYERHRVLVDQLVVMTKAEAVKAEANANAQVTHAEKLLVLILVSALVAGVAIASVIHRSIVNPIQQSLAIARRVAEGDYDVQTEGRTYHDEAGELLAALQQMGASLQQSREAIVARDARLRVAMDHLVESEKLSAMGGLVAGVSHELNTPLGNMITAVSTQIVRIGELQNALTAGTLSKSGLTSVLGDVQEMARLVERNLHRATTQVENFKQLATDQISDQRRSFDLHEVVEECLKSVRLGLRSGTWNLRNCIPNSLVCNGLPGSVAQVVAILVQNAVAHGYRGQDAGDVEVHAQRSGERIELTVVDHGAGMEHAIQQRIFEPFFTTTFGQGRSGLGLAIAYRVITAVLAGEVRVDSTVGSGTTFSVRFPA